MSDYESFEEDLAQAEEPTLEELRDRALRREQQRKEEAQARIAALDVEQEVEGNWFTNLWAVDPNNTEDDGWINNTWEVTGSALEQAAEQVVRTVGDLGDGVNSAMGAGQFVFGDPEFIGGEDAGIGLPFTDRRITYMSAEEFEFAKTVYEIASGKQVANLSNFDLPDVDRPDSAAGQMAEAFTRFMLVFAATRKAMGPANSVRGQVGYGFAAGAAADFAAFDPHEERLSNMLQRFGNEGDDWYDPLLANAVTEYLAADVTDSALEGRLKNAIEGAGIGGVTEGLYQAIRWLRFRHQQRQLNKVESDATEVADDVLDDVELDEVADEVDVPAEPEVPLEHSVDGNIHTYSRNLDSPRDASVEGLDDIQAGKIEAVERGGDTLQVIDVRVADDLQGQGLGSSLYQAVVRQADARGLRMVSDTQVSEQAAHVWESLQKKGHEITDQRVTNPENVETIMEGSTVKYETKNGTPVFTREAGPTTRTAADAAEGAVKQSDETIEGLAREELGEADIPEQVAGSFSFREGLGQEAMERLSQMVRTGNYENVGDLINFNQDKINWDALDEGDQLKQLFSAFENELSPLMGEVTGGVRSLAQTQKIAELAGGSVEGLRTLFGETRHLDSRMLAAHQLMLASAQRLKSLGKVVAEEGGNQALHNFHRQIELHSAVMAMVKGSQQEISRAVSAMRIMREASEQSFKEFEEVTQILGSHKDAKDLIDRYILKDKNTLSDLNSAVRDMAGKRPLDWIVETSVNGMLSAFPTHQINFWSNFGMSIAYPLERYLAAIPASFRGGGRKAIGEATAALIGQFKASGDALQFALRALKEGKPVSDVRQRIEFDTRISIRVGEGDGLFTKGATDKMWQRAINTIGNLVRIPGRLLLAGDELFKTLHKRAELSAQAYRLAYSAAEARKFKTPATRRAFIEREMKLRLKDPSPEMEAHAIEVARYATFQESPLTKPGRGIETFLNSHPVIKLVLAPFVRTPLNLLRQGFVDRNPIFAPFVKAHREAVRAGGREADMVFSRLILGTGVMTTAWWMADEGIITGIGEGYKNTEKLDDIPEYAFHFNGEYHQYNRLDPFGSMMGLIADLHYAIHKASDPHDPKVMSELGEFSQAVMLALTTNVMSKTWMQSLSDTMETATRASEGAGPTAERAVATFVAGNLFKLVPYSSALRRATGTLDPTVREAWNIRDRIWKNLPGLSENLPPQRDLLGREITRANAEGYWLNPFGSRPESDDPVDQELARLSFESTIVQRELGGIPLNSAQYSELKRLINDPGQGPTLHEIFAEIFASEDYQNIPSDFARIEMIKNMVRGRTETAKVLLQQQDPELRHRIRMERQRQNMLRGGVPEDRIHEVMEEMSEQIQELQQ